VLLDGAVKIARPSQFYAPAGVEATFIKPPAVIAAAYAREEVAR
jgi:hypothetical protein